MGTIILIILLFFVGAPLLGLIMKIAEILFSAIFTLIGWLIVGCIKIGLVLFVIVFILCAIGGI